MEPYKTRKIGQLDTWTQWLEAWGRAKTDVELISLLRVGYKMKWALEPAFTKPWEAGAGGVDVGYERDQFYLKCADEKSFLGNDSPVVETIGIRHNLKIEALQQLCTNFFARKILDKEPGVERAFLSKGSEQELIDLLAFLESEMGNSLIMRGLMSTESGKTYEQFLSIFVRVAWPYASIYRKSNPYGNLISDRSRLLLQEKRHLLLETMDSIGKLD